MNEDQSDGVHAAAEHVLKLAEELEAHSDVKTGTSDLERSRASLHAWVDSAIGFVVTPAFGRVTVIHDGGQRSSIASSDLAYAMSVPVSEQSEA